MDIDIEKMMKAADEIKEALPVIARQLFAYYRELVEAGFTPVQALKIVIAHGLNAGGGTNLG